MKRINTGVGNNTPEKSKALDSLVKDDYLTGEVAQCRVDIDKRIHKAAFKLSRATLTADEKPKKVSFRMLMTEAMLDLFEKYQRGEGKYPYDEDDEWSWEG